MSTQYQQPLNGAFTIITFSNFIAMLHLRSKDTWELPGGGEEIQDNKSLELTAVHEAFEEIKVRLHHRRLVKVGKFIQRFKGRLEEGDVELYQAQTFHFPESAIGSNFNLYKKYPLNTRELENTDEADRICFIHVSDILDDSMNVNLAHKRMILHWLNWNEITRKLGTCFIEDRLGNKVSAFVPPKDFSQAGVTIEF